LVEAYHYVRFRWWTRLDLEKISKELAEEFDVKMIAQSGDVRELALHKDDRNELEVKSDTLIAFISPFRAVLSQGEPSPFTSRDMNLRKKIIELYPKNRPTPFPWKFSEEPKFEVAEEK
jgi:hypothetical protein